MNVNKFDSFTVTGPFIVGKESNGLKREKRIGMSQPCAPMEPDRGVAARLVAQRNEDKAAGVVTEKYSGLRIK